MIHVLKWAVDKNVLYFYHIFNKNYEENQKLVVTTLNDGDGTIGGSHTFRSCKRGSYTSFFSIKLGNHTFLHPPYFHLFSYCIYLLARGARKRLNSR